MSLPLSEDRDMTQALSAKGQSTYNDRQSSQLIIKQRANTVLLLYSYRYGSPIYTTELHKTAVQKSRRRQPNTANSAELPRIQKATKDRTNEAQTTGYDDSDGTVKDKSSHTHGGQQNIEPQQLGKEREKEAKSVYTLQWLTSSCGASRYVREVEAYSWFVCTWKTSRFLRKNAEQDSLL